LSQTRNDIGGMKLKSAKLLAKRKKKKNWGGGENSVKKNWFSRTVPRVSIARHTMDPKNP